MSTKTISSGDEIISGASLNYGDALILSGGTAVETIIDGGTMSVLTGGYASDTTMDGAGSMTVNRGIAENTIMGISSGSYQSMYLTISNGSANNTTVNNGGSMTLHYGAEVTNTTINSSGRVMIDGGTMTGVTFNQGASLANYSGTVNNAVLNGWGNFYVSQSGVVNDTIINSGGNLMVSGGAAANGTVVNSGGSFYISAATANNTTVNSNAYFYLYAGVADGVTVNQGGVFSPGPYWNGGETDSAVNVVENGGAVYVGGSHNYTTSETIYFPVTFAANSFGGLDINAACTIHSGTTAADLTAANGQISVYAGGILTNATITDSSYYTYYDWTDEEGVVQHESSLVYETGQLSVMSGGTATGIIGNTKGDDWSRPFYFEIAPGTVISGTLNGDEFATTNGILTDYTANGIDLAFLSGATVTNINMVWGGASVQPGAFVTGLNLSAASLDIARGASVDGITTTPLSSSYVDEVPWSVDDPDYEPEVIDYMAGAVVSANRGTTVTNLIMDEYSYLRMAVTSDTILHAVSSGVALDTENGFFGNVALNSTYVDVAESSSFYDSATGTYTPIAGGTVSDLILNNGATVVASNGAMAMNITENGGALLVDDNEDNDQAGITYSIVSNTFSNEHLTGVVTVHKNTIASGCIMDPHGGQGDNFCELKVHSGGIVEDFYTVQKGMGMAQIEFKSGAIVRNFDMVRYAQPPFHGGHVDIQPGAQINGIRLMSDDFVSLYLTSDTVIKNAAVDNKPFTFEGGVLSGYRMNEGMNSNLSIGEGITAIVDVWVTDCPIYTNGGLRGINVTLDRSYMFLSEGDYFENLTVATGTYRGTYEYDGKTVVNYDYGSATVEYGAVVDGVTVNKGGTLNIRSGGKLTGVMRFDSSNNIVSCGSGAIIDFDLTDKSALYVARSNDWRFNGSDSSEKPKYTITVDQQQGAGTYVLSNSTYFSDSKNFYVVDGTNGYEYGYFSGYFDYKWVSAEEYQYYFVSNYYGETIEGLTLTMDAIQVDRDDGVLDFDLVLKVESNYAAPKWVAAPTVTADNEKFTCKDVLLTVNYDESVVTKEISLDDGATWMSFGGYYSTGVNGRFKFRGTDANGTVSDVTTYTVSNIDKVAPTVATGLSASVIEGSTVTLDWIDATDDFSGVSSFYVACWQDGGASFTQVTPGTELTVDSLSDGTWHWALQTIDYAGNASAAAYGADFVVSGSTVTPQPYIAKGDIDGNGVSDVLFQYTGGDYQLGYWMNGTNEWRGQGLAKPAEWEVLGSYDMNSNGNADAVLVGNVTTEIGGKGAYIGYYLDSVDTDANWQNIGYLNNEENIAWKNKVGNLTGNEGKNSIVWYAPELFALGAWTDGTTEWVTLSASFGGNDWNLIGCGDFNGDGKDSVVMNYNNGQFFYAAGIGSTPQSLGGSDWRGWELRAIGDFAGDGKDDIVLFHNDTGSMVMCADGNVDSYVSIGQLAADDWFVVGAGDYNGDQKDDLLVRQKSTGMLGYYNAGDVANGWVELGRGVDTNWTVIA